MPYTFTFDGNIPSKKNSKRLIVKNRYGRALRRPMLLSSESHEKWKVNASWDIKGQDRPRNPLTKENNLKIELTLWADGLRKADLTNKTESIMDLLVEMQILEDDNWFVVGDLHLRFGGVDKKNPRAVVVINYDEKK